MTAWTLHLPGGPATGLAGYTVTDMLGAPSGVVAGWVADPAGTVRLLVVARAEAAYLVPSGLCDAVDDDTRRITLRHITGNALPHECPALGVALPAAAVLEALLARHPDPRPHVAERLLHPDREPPARRPARLTVTPARGDGARTPAPPVPDWCRLTRLVRPPWRPLDRLGNDEAA